jgi:hypothetical protein
MSATLVRSTSLSAFSRAPAFGLRQVLLHSRSPSRHLLVAHGLEVKLCALAAGQQRKPYTLYPIPYTLSPKPSTVVASLQGSSAEAPKARPRRVREEEFR